jgi:hypothetical protein
MHRSSDGGVRLAKPMDEPNQLPLGEARQDTERSPRLASECIANAPESALCVGSAIATAARRTVSLAANSPDQPLLSFMASRPRQSHHGRQSQ